MFSQRIAAGSTRKKIIKVNMMLRKHHLVKPV